MPESGMCRSCVRRIKTVLCMMAQLTRYEGRRHRRRRRQRAAVAFGLAASRRF